MNTGGNDCQRISRRVALSGAACTRRGGNRYGGLVSGSASARRALITDLRWIAIASCQTLSRPCPRKALSSCAPGSTKK